jgi:hypothetical protein
MHRHLYSITSLASARSLGWVWVFAADSSGQDHAIQASIALAADRAASCLRRSAAAGPEALSAPISREMDKQNPAATAQTTTAAMKISARAFDVQLEPEQRQPDPTDHKQRSCRSGECYNGNGSFDYYVRAHILTLDYKEPPAEQ